MRLLCIRTEPFVLCIRQYLSHRTIRWSLTYLMFCSSYSLSFALESLRLKIHDRLQEPTFAMSDYGQLAVRCTKHDVASSLGHHE
jgi:hypothetical protein